MNKIAKILLIILCITGLIYAQVDSTVKQDSLKTILKEKAVTKITPKVPTNWSKVKDLFL